VSRDDAWAAGNYIAAQDNSGERGSSLLMHWNGSAWSQVRVPQMVMDNNVPAGVIDNQDNTLNGIDALSSDDVWAVGSATANGGNVGKTLILHYTGSPCSTPV